MGKKITGKKEKKKKEKKESRTTHKGSGLLIAVEGIDGSGKGTVINHYGGLLDCLREHIQDMQIFDVDEWQSSQLGEGRFSPITNPGTSHRPLYENDNVKGEVIPRTPGLKESDVILLSEPSYGGSGYDVRFEVIQDNGREYSARSTAQSYSLDREVLDKRIVLPALNNGKVVIKSRCMASSLVYQPVQAQRNREPKLNPEYLIGPDFPGNNHQLLHVMPDLLIIQTISAEEAMERLKGRKEKIDGALFEELGFQKAISMIYQEKWLRDIYEARGTRVVYVDVEKSKEEVAEEASSHLETLLRERRGIIDYDK